MKKYYFIFLEEKKRKYSVFTLFSLMKCKKNACVRSVRGSRNGGSHHLFSYVVIRHSLRQE